jgi:hypothetical protein
MAAGDIVYGTRTVLANISRLHSDTNGIATAFGEVDNTSEKAPNYLIHLKVPIHASAVGGSYDLYMVESQDGTEWTDSIDPSGSDSDYVDFIKDAIPIRSASTIYDNSPTGARINVEFHFNVASHVPVPAPFFGFVLVNRSGQTIPSSGADGDSQSQKIAAS